jgi:hypothetical protein
MTNWRYYYCKSKLLKPIVATLAIRVVKIPEAKPNGYKWYRRRSDNTASRLYNTVAGKRGVITVPYRAP